MYDMCPLKHLSAICVVTCALTVLPGCHRSSSSAGGDKAAAGQVRTDTTAQVVLEVSRSARLYTSEFIIHKIVTHSDNPVIEGNVLGVPVKMKAAIGNRKMAIPIDVTLKAYIDFADFSEKNVTRTDSTITVTLPDPVIMASASKVDHKAMRQYVDGMRSRYSDAEIAEYARQGADSVISHADKFGIVAQAERSAAATLIPMLQRMGYKEHQISVRFRKKFTENELFRMTQKQ